MVLGTRQLGSLPPSLTHTLRVSIPGLRTFLGGGFQDLGVERTVSIYLPSSEEAFLQPQTHTVAGPAFIPRTLKLYESISFYSYIGYGQLVLPEP